MKIKESLMIEGTFNSLPVDKNDKVTRKFAMLFEGCCTIGVAKTINKYGYTEQRYYQLLKAYKEKGSAGLIDKPKGPKSNRIRTKRIINQIIRYRFLDPDDPPAVIAQKMRQSGIKISKRSVERTITAYGLQKKTLQVKSRRSAKTNRNTCNKKK